MQPSDEMIEAACEAMAITSARQDGVTLTPAGFRQGRDARPEEHRLMREYVQAALTAALARAEANAEVGEVVAVSNLRDRLDEEFGGQIEADVDWWESVARFVIASHPAPQPSGQVKALPEGTISLHGNDVTIAFDNREEAEMAFDLLEPALYALAAGKPEQEPSGWKLVPEDADDAMVSAALDVDWSGGDGDEAAVVHNLWHVMLSAAPASPTAGGDDAE